MNKQDIKTKKVIKDIKEKNNQNNIKYLINFIKCTYMMKKSVR